MDGEMFLVRAGRTRFYDLGEAAAVLEEVCEEYSSTV
jgi:hypothetical protein